MTTTAATQSLWLISLGSHMPVLAGDILDMPGAPEPVRLLSLRGTTEARVLTSGGKSVVDLATVGIVLGDPSLGRPRPGEGPIDHREHRVGGLTGAGEDETFWISWTTVDGFTSEPLPFQTELAALVAFLGCVSNPGHARAQLVRRRPGAGEVAIAAFDRGGLAVPVQAVTRGGLR